MNNMVYSDCCFDQTVVQYLIYSKIIQNLHGFLN